MTNKPFSHVAGLTACFLGMVFCAGLRSSEAAGLASNRVIQVAVSGAMCAAVQDDSQRLVIGVRESNTVRLVMYSIDGRGHILLSTSNSVVMSKSDALKDYSPYPLDVIWHPRLPLCYVWQDVTGPSAQNPAKNPVFSEFDHLAVYSAADGSLQWIQSYARGKRYASRQTTGRIAVDPQGKRLFIPNMMSLAGDRAQLGYLVLDTNGLPVLVEGKAAPFAGDIMDIRSNPSGYGFVAPTDRAIIFSSAVGPATWDTDNRRAPLNQVLVRNLPVYCYLGGHPQWPAVFGAAVGGNILYRVEQAEGYLSLLPQTLVVSNATFTAPPVIMQAKPAHVAVGGVNKLHFLGLDGLGRLDGTTGEWPVNCPAVKAMAYSVKYDRLYVAVEKLP